MGRGGLGTGSSGGTHWIISAKMCRLVRVDGLGGRFDASVLWVYVDKVETPGT